MAKGELRHGSASLKEIFQLMIEEMNISDKLMESKILQELPELLGDIIFSKVEDYYIYRDKLFIRTYSAPLRHELLNCRQLLIKKLNDIAGQDLLKEIIIK